MVGSGRVHVAAWAAVVVALVAGDARAQAQPAAGQAVAQARAALDSIEAEVARLKQGDVAPGNALLNRLVEVRRALYAASGLADEAWGEALKRLERLDRRIREVCTGKPSPAPEPDETTRQALAIIEEVEAGLRQLNPGEGSRANGLVARAGEAKRLLGASKTLTCDAWIDACVQATGLEPRIRARYAEKPAASAPQGPPTPGERPPAAPRPLSASDGWALRQGFYPVWDDATAALPRTETADLGLSRFAERFRDDVRRMLDAIKAVGEQAHPDVQWCRQRLAAFNELLERRIGEGIDLQQARQRDRMAAVEDVNRRLAELQAFFDPKTFSCGLEAPYTVERVAAWAADVRKWQQVARAGQAEVREIETRYPALAKDPAVLDVARRFERWLPGQVGQAITNVTGWAPDGARRTPAGKLPELVARAEATTKVNLGDDLLADDAWVAQCLTELREGAEAALALQRFGKDVFGKDEPALAQTAARLKAFAQGVEARGQKVLAGTRMPRAATSDAALERLVRDCLANPDYGVGKFERLVISSAPRRETAVRRDSWVDGNYLYVRTWTEEWDEMQVALAEHVGEHLRVVYYTLKFVHRSAGMKPEGRWYLHQRLESARILPENVGK